MELREQLLQEVTKGLGEAIRRPGLFIVPSLRGSEFTVRVDYGWENAVEHKHTVELNDPSSLYEMEKWLARVVADPDEHHEAPQNEA